MIINSSTSYNFFINYYNKQYSNLLNHRNRIFDLVQNQLFLKSVSDKLSRRGYQPTLSKENGIYDRIKHAKLEKFLDVDFSKTINKDLMLESLEKSKSNNTTEPKLNVDNYKLIKATERVLKNCKFPKLRFNPLDINTTWDTCINKSASSGFPLFKKKGLIRNELLSEAIQLTSGTKSPNIPFNDNPMTVGFRSQLRKEIDNVVVKLRVMYPITGIITLLEAQFAAPFINHFQTLDTFYTIGRNGQQLGNLLRTRLNKSKNILSSDISSFDQSMSNTLIILSFSILRKQLKLTPVYEHIFTNIISYFCSSIVFYKIGKDKPNYYIKTHGIPSGSCFTNIIGTLCHAIILEYIYPNCTLDNALICSDDNIIDLGNINSKKFIKLYKYIFDLTISKTKSKTFTSGKLIYFLGFTWYNYVRYVDTKLVLNQCVWHSDYRTDLDRYERELARCASILLNGKNGTKLFQLLFPDVMKQLKNGKNVRFLYLYGSKPPTRIIEFNKDTSTSRKGDVNSSLAYHLYYGHLVR